MKNAKQIAEIVQSEHIWNFFVRSKLFTHAVPNDWVLIVDEVKPAILKGTAVRFESLQRLGY